MEQSLLSQRLKELRKVNNYTQDYVAAVIGTTRQTYSHYETGRRKPSTETLYKLSGLYNISVDDLLHLSVELDRNVYYEAPVLPKPAKICRHTWNTLTTQEIRKVSSTIPIWRRNCYIIFR